MQQFQFMHQSLFTKIALRDILKGGPKGPVPPIHRTYRYLFITINYNFIVMYHIN